MISLADFIAKRLFLKRHVVKNTKSLGLVTCLDFVATDKLGMDFDSSETLYGGAYAGKMYSERRKPQHLEHSIERKVDQILYRPLVLEDQSFEYFEYFTVECVGEAVGLVAGDLPFERAGAVSE